MGQSTIVNVIWDVTNGIKAYLPQYDVVWGTNQAEASGHVTPEADEDEEWSPLHKAWQWATPGRF